MAGALLVSGTASWWQLLGAWLVPTCGWLASLYGGDYFDRNLDSIGKAHRSIPSGRMSPSVALAGMTTTIVLGAAVAVVLHPLNIIFVVLAGILGVSYSRALKARGILGNVIRGGPTALSLLLGGTTIIGTVPIELLPVALMFWLHDSSSNLVGALCDKDSDGLGGYHTFPVRHGDAATIRVVIWLDLCWIVLAAGILFWWRSTDLRTADISMYGVFLGSAIAVAAVSVGILLRAPRPVPRLAGLRSHEVIVIERLFLPAAFIAGAGGLATALAWFLPSLAITMLAQLLMRRRYEPGRIGRRSAPVT